MIKRTKNNFYFYKYFYKILLELSLTYHPNARRGKKSKHDELLKIVHPVAIKNDIDEDGDISSSIHDFAIDKALRFIEEIGKVDKEKQDYYDIYCKNYFKKDDLERFDIYKTADDFYCTDKRIRNVIDSCNHIVHSFVMYYYLINLIPEVDTNSFDEYIKPYYAFVDSSINIDDIIKKLKL